MRERHGALAHFGSVPAADFARELAAHELPWTSRPAYRPLDRYSVWLVWMQWPHQVLGLLTLLGACGLASRAADRSPGSPWILVAGPACASASAVLLAFADAVSTHDDPAVAVATLDEILNASPPRRETLAAMPSLRMAAEAPRRSHEVPQRGEDGAEPARTTPPWVVQACDLRAPTVERTVGALGGKLSIVRVGAASERLRSAHGLPCGSAIVQSVRSEFAASSEVALEIAIGLPTERPEDRAAIVPLAQRLVREAPYGPKQLLVKLGPYLPTGDEVASAPSVGALRERLERIASDLRRHKIRCEVGDAGCAWTGAVIASASTEQARVVEWVHEAGARVGESALACRPDLWHKAWQAEGEVGHGGVAAPAKDPLLRWISAAEAEDRDEVGIAAATGLPEWEAPRVEPSSPARGNGQSPDRWTRWHALAPRQFDYRFEFVKRGPMRFIGHRELWSMWVGAIAAARLPLATSGLVQPRPKITFGPPLPLGVEGLREYVDVSLTRKTPDLQHTLNGRFPSGLWIHEAAFIPAVAGRVSLGMVTRADYEVCVQPRHSSSGSIPLTAIQTRAQRLMDGSAGASARIHREETTIDLRTQIVTLRVQADPGNVLRVTFSLDLTPSGAKARPQDVLAYLLADEVRDQRTLPIQRIRLLVPRDASSGQLLTPMEQVRLAHRTLRARAKMCA